MNIPVRLQGIAWMLFGAVGIGGMSGLTHLVREEVSAPTAIFWRSVVVVSVAALMAKRQKISLRPGSPKMLAWRSFTGLTAMVAYFWALGEIDLGPAATLIQTAPLFIALLSGRVLGEASDRKTLLPTGLAFLGVVFILQPTDLSLEWGEIAALSAGFIAALAYMAVRSLRETDPPARIVFWFAALSGVVTAPWALMDNFPNGAGLWIALLGVGVTATVGQLAMTQALRLEKANVVGPFAYATVGISYLLGVIFWDERPTLLATVGMAMVVASGIWLSRAANAQPSSAKASEEPKSQQKPQTS